MKSTTFERTMKKTFCPFMISPLAPINLYESTAVAPAGPQTCQSYCNKTCTLHMHVYLSKPLHRQSLILVNVNTPAPEPVHPPATVPAPASVGTPIYKSDCTLPCSCTCSHVHHHMYQSLSNTLHLHLHLYLQLSQPCTCCPTHLSKSVPRTISRSQSREEGEGLGPTLTRVQLGRAVMSATLLP